MDALPIAVESEDILWAFWREHSFNAQITVLYPGKRLHTEAGVGGESLLYFRGVVLSVDVKVQESGAQNAMPLNYVMILGVHLTRFWVTLQCVAEIDDLP